MSLNTILATVPNTTNTYILKASGTSIGNSIMYQDSGGSINVAYLGTTGGARIRITPDSPQGYIESVDASGNPYKLVLATGGLSVRNGLSTSLLEIATSGASTFTSSVTAAGTASTPTFWAKGGMDGSGTGKGNIRSSDAGGSNYFDFGRDNLSTGNFVLTSGGGSPLLSVTTSGAATFASGVTASGLNSTIAKSGSGVESTNLIALRATGSGAIGDALNLRFLNTDGVHIANIAGILGADNTAYGSLAFSVRNYNTDAMTEAMRINNRGNVGIGTSSPSNKLSVSGTVSATDLLLQGSASLNFEYTTNSSWASGFQTIIPINGAQVTGGVYLVRVQWGSGGSPYVVYAPFLWSCMGSNGGGADNTISPMTSTHQGGTGTMNFRNIAGVGQVASGVQVQLIGFANSDGTLSVTATRLM